MVTLATLADRDKLHMYFVANQRDAFRNGNSQVEQVNGVLIYVAENEPSEEG